MFEKKTYSKKEIYQKINMFEEYMNKLEKYGSENYTQIRTLANAVRDLLKENAELRSQVDMLTRMSEGTLGEAPACQFFMVKSYRGMPVVFKDGKLLSSEKMKDLCVQWDRAEDGMNVEINT